MCTEQILDIRAEITSHHEEKFAKIQEMDGITP